MRKAFIAGAILLLAFLALQFFNPKPTNPPGGADMLSTLRPPAKVAHLFVEACYDCHSHQTRWPWYSRVAPVSWLIANDVKEGRQNLDLSEWPVTDNSRAAKRLEDMSDQVSNAQMPPKKYTLIHKGARLDDADRQALEDWLDGEADQLRPPKK